MENENQTTQNFGDWLKDLRTSKRVTLEEIAAVTKVHINHLQALEKNEFKSLPPNAFVRGFLVSFARHIGIDENMVLDRFKLAQISQGGAPTTAILMPEVKRLAQTVESPKVKIVTNPGFIKSPLSGKDDEIPPFYKQPKIMGTIAAVCATIALLVLLVKIGQESSEEQKAAEAQVPAPVAVENPTAVTPPVQPEIAKPAAPAVPAPAPAQQVAASKPAVVSPVPVASPTPAVVYKHRLEVRALERAWVNVRVDDGRSQGFSLAPGAVQSFPAMRKVNLALSNAGVVELAWDGVWYQPAGYRGDIKTLVFPEGTSTLTTKAAASAQAKLRAKPAVSPTATPAASAVAPAAAPPAAAPAPAPPAPATPPQQ